MSHPIALTSALVAQSLPVSLNGCNGANRCPASLPKQIHADDDVAAIAVWLAEYVSSPHTFRSYRKEAVRLLRWSTEVRGKAVSSLMREDVLAYEAFLASQASDTTTDGPHLSVASQRQALGIVSGLFAYLVNAGYLAANPWALRRRRAVKRRRSVERFLDRRLWESVLTSVDAWAQVDARSRQHLERVRFVLRFLHSTGLRASEAANAKVSDFFQRRGRWWLHVLGKGCVEGEVPISEALLEDFARYRRFYGLAPVPSPTDHSPIILAISGRGTHALTSTSIYLIVKSTFACLADQLEASDAVGASTLRRASTHWLRHTAATHQADAGNDLRHIQRNMRHASIETTAIYLHVEEDERHFRTTQAHA